MPTAETAKPILKKRKPPADPGPAPFKNARFSNLTNVLEIKKKKKNRPAARTGLLETPGSVARSHGRRLLFSPARRARALAPAGLPGTFAGAHARSRPCVRRGEGALSGPCVRRTRAGLGARAREARGAPASERSRLAGERASGARRIPPLWEPPAPSSPLSPRRLVAEPRGRVGTRLGAHPTMAASARHGGCSRRPRGQARWHA